MARPGRPERNRAARSFGQLRRFHHGINSDKVFGTHSLSSFSANHTTSFFLVSGFGSGAYSANELNGTRQRFSGLSQSRQCGDPLFLMLVTGGPPVPAGVAVPRSHSGAVYNRSQHMQRLARSAAFE